MPAFTLASSENHPMPANDLSDVLRLVGPDWESLRGQRLLLTGGTGIIGKWLLSSLLFANRELGLSSRVTVLSRNPRHFARMYPLLANDAAVTLLAGDVRHFEAASTESCSHVIHGALDVVDQGGPADILQTCIAGTSQVIEQANRLGAARMLLLSSGSVYGKTPLDTVLIDEDCRSAPVCQSGAGAYGEGKRCAELLCAIENERPKGITIPVARCFAMVGPYLPLDKHFAIGNFIGAALRGEPVTITGDGTPLRSYLHAVDVTAWLWLLLLRGQGQRAYNVGSEVAVSIQSLAERVVAVLGSNSTIDVLGQHTPEAHANRYVPSAARMALEFGVRQSVTLDQAILRTADWHRAKSLYE